MTEEHEDTRHEHLADELEDLKKELKHFEKEKERIRAIVGQIGGVPKMQANLVNALFVIVLLVTVVVSFFANEKWHLIMIELATVTLSIKIIYLIHAQMRIAHFEFWILSSLEWRVNEVMKQVRNLKKEIAGKATEAADPAADESASVARE